MATTITSNPTSTASIVDEWWSNLDGSLITYSAFTEGQTYRKNIEVQATNPLYAITNGTTKTMNGAAPDEAVQDPVTGLWTLSKDVVAIAKVVKRFYVLSQNGALNQTAQFKTYNSNGQAVSSIAGNSLVQFTLYPNAASPNDYLSAKQLFNPASAGLPSSIVIPGSGNFAIFNFIETPVGLYILGSRSSNLCVIKITLNKDVPTYSLVYSGAMPTSTGSVIVRIAYDPRPYTNKTEPVVVVVFYNSYSTTSASYSCRYITGLNALTSVNNGSFAANGSLDRVSDSEAYSPFVSSWVDPDVPTRWATALCFVFYNPGFSNPYQLSAIVANSTVSGNLFRKAESLRSLPSMNLQPINGALETMLDENNIQRTFVTNTDLATLINYNESTGAWSVDNIGNSSNDKIQDSMLIDKANPNNVGGQLEKAFIFSKNDNNNRSYLSVYQAIPFPSVGAASLLSTSLTNFANDNCFGDKTLLLMSSPKFKD